MSPQYDILKLNNSTTVSFSSSQVENANTLSMKCSDVYLYESSLQPDQFGSLPKLQVSPKSLPLPAMMMTTMRGVCTKMEMKKAGSIALQSRATLIEPFGS